MPRKPPARKRRTRRTPAARRTPAKGARRTAPRRRRPAGPPPAPDDLTRLGDAPTRAAAAAAPVAVLRVLRCPDPALVHREFPVRDADVTLGRDSESTVALADPGVSRFHARIVRTGNSHVLVDMESTNGVSVNGVRVSEVTLRAGDRLVLGDTTLIYEA